MIRRPPRSTRTDTLFPYTTLFRSGEIALGAAEHMLVAIDAVVAGIAGADRHRVIIVEHRLHRGGGLEIDDADVAFAAGDPCGFAQRRARIDFERGGQAVGPGVAVRSAERRGGKGCVSTCSSRWSQYQ